MRERIDYKANGSIWKLLVDFEKKLTWLEVRNESTMELAYDCLHLDSGKLLWKGLESGATWWSGMIAAKSGYLFISKYSNEKNPDPEALLAINSESGEVLWEKEKGQFEAVESSSVFISKSESGQKEYFEVELKTGAEHPAELENLPELKAEPYELPHRYFEGEEYFDTVKQFLAQKIGGSAVRVINYLEKKGRVMLSYYVSEKEGLNHFLLVMDTDGEIILHEKTDEGLKGIATSNFFVVGNLLLFINKQSSLKAFEI